jgi:hypothetical protein
MKRHSLINGFNLSTFKSFDVVQRSILEAHSRVILSIDSTPSDSHTNVTLVSVLPSVASVPFEIAPAPLHLVLFCSLSLLMLHHSHPLIFVDTQHLLSLSLASIDTENN